MAKFTNKILTIIIGTILLFLLFFPINYQRDKKKITDKTTLNSIYNKYNINFDPSLVNYSDSNPLCFLIFPTKENFHFNIQMDCAIFLKEEQLKKDFPITLNFINDIYESLEKNSKKVSIISEGFYNTLALEIAAHFPKVSLLILKDEIYTPIPFIWSYIEPRVCFSNKELCNKYKIIKYVHREEIYERIQSPIIWIINKSDLQNQNVALKKSLEIFSQLGNSFSPKKILFEEEILNQEIDITDFIQQQ
jgi:hypothetical protein